jgi:hypothetical protein
MSRVMAEGSPTGCEADVQKDSDGNLYDLTRQFIEQQMLYPFAQLKDLIDAASRIYDMEPKPPRTGTSTRTKTRTDITATGFVANVVAQRIAGGNEDQDRQGQVHRDA